MKFLRALSILLFIVSPAMADGPAWGIATTSAPGVVQVGSGLSITAAGVLSSSGGGVSASTVTNIAKGGYTDQLFVEVWGNDGNAGTSPLIPLLTVTNAVAIATNAIRTGTYSNVVINVGYGWFDLPNPASGNWYNDLVNIAIVGKTQGNPLFQTLYLNNANTIQTNQMTVIAAQHHDVLCLGQNSSLKNLTYWQSEAGNPPLEVVGTLADDNTYPGFATMALTNMVVQNCNLYGINAHTVYMTSTNPIGLTFDHVFDFVGNYGTDCLLLFGCPNTNNSIYLVNSFFSYGNVTGSGNLGEAPIFLNGLSGTVSLNACTVQSFGTNVTRTPCVLVDGTNLTLNIAGSAFSGNGGGNINTNLSLNSSSLNTTVNISSSQLTPYLVADAGSGDLINWQAIRAAWAFLPTNASPFSTVSNIASVVSGGHYTNVWATRATIHGGILCVEGASTVGGSANSATAMFEPSINGSLQNTGAPMAGISSQSVGTNTAWTSVSADLGPGDWFTVSSSTVGAQSAITYHDFYFQ